MALRLKRAASARPRTQPEPETAARLAALLGIAAVVAANVVLTWGRWGDVVTDVGRELDTALQLSQGRRLYADVRSYYGPLAPYVNAFLFRLFGARVEVLAVAGVVTGALLAAVVYRCVRLFANRLPAAAAAVAVLQAGVFLQMYTNNIFNFVLPYSYAATYGTLLATASVFFLVRYLLFARERDLWMSAGLLSLVSLSKIEPLFAAGMAHAAGLLCSWAQGQRSVRRLAVYGLPAGVAAVAYGYFYSITGAGLVHDNLVLRSNATAGNYAMRHSGLLEWRESLLQVSISAALFAACAAAAWWATRRGGVVAAAGAGLVIAALVIGGGTGRQLRLVPLMLVVIAGQLVWRARQARRLETTDAALLTLVAFGIGSAARVILHGTAEHYGFYLLMPSLCAFAAWIGGALPPLLPARQRTAAAGLAAAWLFSVALSHAARTHRTALRNYGSLTPERVGTLRGALPVPIPYQGTIDAAVRFLEAQPRGSRVLVVPHGVGITFLAGQQNALGVHALLPPDMAGAYDDARLIADLERDPPDFVVVTSADTREYGKQGFGIDYAQALSAWIHAHYGVREQWRSNFYQAAVLGRRGR